MIVAFAAIILALSNGITLLISTISLSTFKAIRACGIECKMSDNDSCSDTEEDDNDVFTRATDDHKNISQIPAMVDTNS